MSASLCGRGFCRRLCGRVCHCPAGLSRVSWLWFLRRVEREQHLKPAPFRVKEHLKLGRIPKVLSQARAIPIRPCPPGVNPETREFNQQHRHLGQLREGVLYNVFGAREYPSSRKHIKYGTRLLKPFTSQVFLIAFLVFMVLVLLSGLIVNGNNLIPHYEPDPHPCPLYEEWWFEK